MDDRLIRIRESERRSHIILLFFGEYEELRVLACQMLARGQESVTVISHACGLGSSSYFGKVFQE